LSLDLRYRETIGPCQRSRLDMNIVTNGTPDPQFILCVLMFLAGLLVAKLPWPWQNRRVKNLLRDLDEARLANTRLIDKLDDYRTETEAGVAELRELLDERTNEADQERRARTSAEEELRHRERLWKKLEERASSDVQQVPDSHAAQAPQQLSPDVGQLHTVQVPRNVVPCESELDNLRLQLEERTVELAHAQQELAAVEALLAEQRDTNSRHEQRYTDLRRQMRSSKTEYSEVLSERDHVRNQLEQERSRRESVESSKESLEQELTRLRGELAESQLTWSEERAALERTIHEGEARASELTRERDVLQTALQEESDAREGVQHLLSERRGEIAQLTTQLTDTRAERDATVAGLKQQLRAGATTIAQLQREIVHCESRISTETVARQSAEQARQELLSESQRLTRELEKADALLEERLYLTRKLNDRDTLLRELRGEYESLQREFDKFTKGARFAA
jgi:chromosome segregation ATPase